MKIYARQCQIQDISDKRQLVSEFLDDNHLQGNCRGNKYVYGLFYKNELVQLLSFGTPRYNYNYQFELIRDCTKKNYVVIGGVSRLWKHFLKDKNVRNCICYSYPHDNKFTEKYIKYCGFKNISKSKPTKKTIFSIKEEGKLKTISLQELNRLGVDRFLGTHIGTNYKNNEDILIELGWDKQIVDDIAPQVDIYFPFGLVYKITDEDTGKFYIGESTNQKTWDKGYLGSGERWKRHLQKNPKHSYKREIIKNNFKTPKELCEYELKIIEESIDNPNCYNLRTQIQGNYPDEQVIRTICSECGGIRGAHKKGCTQYKESKPCPECGKTKGGHFKWCSNYVPADKCPECGRIRGHRKNCSRATVCSECGAVNNSHKKTCSHFTESKGCPECGGKNGQHHIDCSHYIDLGKCPECGYSLKSHRHAPTCSHYKAPKTTICSECGCKNGNHHIDCSHYRVSICPECKGKNGHHKKGCSQYVLVYATPCPECGGVYGHKDSCSKSKGKCSECGYSLKSHRHAPTCSHYKPIKQSTKTCPECGGQQGKHRKKCSKYKGNPICLECGSPNNAHKKTCSHYRVVICPECGGKAGHHKSTCSKIQGNG